MEGMLQRTRKQITYGAGFLVVIAALISIRVYFQGGLGGNAGTEPIPGTSFLPIQLEALDVIRHDSQPGEDTLIDIVARLKNPNPAAGTGKYPIIFVIKNATGQELQRVPVETYLVPGAVQYVMALNVSTNRQLFSTVEAELPSAVDFKVLPADVSLPSFSSFARERTDKQIGEKLFEEQKGIVKNTGTFEWQKVEVYVVGLSASNKVIAAGKTFVGALQVGEEREFNVEWPKAEDEISRLVILPATNIYRDENLIRTVGNPSLLR